MIFLFVIRVLDGPAMSVCGKIYEGHSMRSNDYGPNALILAMNKLGRGVLHAGVGCWKPRNKPSSDPSIGVTLQVRGRSLQWHRLFRVSRTRRSLRNPDVPRSPSRGRSARHGSALPVCPGATFKPVAPRSRAGDLPRHRPPASYFFSPRMAKYRVVSPRLTQNSEGCPAFFIATAER